MISFQSHIHKCFGKFHLGFYQIDWDWDRIKVLRRCKLSQVGKRSHLSGANIEKKCIIYTIAIMHESRVKQSVLNKSGLVWNE